MTDSKIPNSSATANTQTEADKKSLNGLAEKDDKSSHDAKSHTKAGTDTGAGGGKKQERQHR